MSRGHGAVERAILKQAEHRATQLNGEVTHGALVTLPYIAWLNHQDWVKKSVRQSFSRAARNLADQGIVDLYEYSMAYARDYAGRPTKYLRTLSVCPPGLEITDEVVDNMDAGHALFLG
jgi:hypothetical protein